MAPAMAAEISALGYVRYYQLMDGIEATTA
jgi:hypothetical protein